MTLFDGDAGAEFVEELLAEAHEGKKELCMSAVNWGEVFYTMWNRRGQAAAELAAVQMSQWPMQVLSADLLRVKAAALWKARHKLPYADSFTATLAEELQATVVTTDADFKTVSGQVNVKFLK
jgi:predicted nucleic acid-binding protein